MQTVLLQYLGDFGDPSIQTELENMTEECDHDVYFDRDYKGFKCSKCIADDEDFLEEWYRTQPQSDFSPYED